MIQCVRGDTSKLGVTKAACLPSPESAASALPRRKCLLTSCTETGVPATLVTAVAAAGAAGVGVAKAGASTTATAAATATRPHLMRSIGATFGASSSHAFPGAVQFSEFDGTWRIRLTIPAAAPSQRA